VHSAFVERQWEHRRRLGRGVEHLPAPVLLFDADGLVLAANPAACSELGRCGAELFGGGLVESLRPDSGHSLREALRAAGGPDGEGARLTVRRPAHRRGDDFFELRIQPGHSGSIVAAVFDTTEARRSIVEAMPVGVVITDAAGVALYRNELALDLLGLDTADVGRTDWTSGLGSASADELDRVLTAALESQRHGTLVVQLDREGGPLWLRVDAVPQVDEAGRTFGMVATLLDVTAETLARVQLAHAKERLWDLATHDPLTHLANRTLFVEHVERALARTADGDHGVAVLYCDLDDFKPVNDRYGHAAGDAVLKVVAERILGAVRAGDLVARFGGDEFLVLCDGVDDGDVVHLRDRLVETVGRPIAVEGAVIRIGMTVGIARATTGTEVEALIRDADFSMYSRKASGEVRA
jgi:diguanylate cyclase (GGDEF)-like protein/PAS domain S-box-containing protein